MTQEHFDSGKYWIERHEQFDQSHQATGLVDSTHLSNRVLYDLRRMALKEAVGTDDLSGKTVLDAGCGLGDFSRVYRDLNAQLFGCDISPLAVEKCNAAGLGDYRSGRLADIPDLFPDQRFDYVHCFDVMYHIVDDSEWYRTIAAFDAVSKPDTKWLLIELSRAKGSSPHVKVRGTESYRREVAKYGRQITRDRRIHWLLSVFPRLHSINPRFSYTFEWFAVWGLRARWRGLLCG